MKDFMLIIHFIGLAMGLGSGFANLFLGEAAKKLSKEDALKLKMNSLVLRKMGIIGLMLLILSGGYMMTPYWETLHLMPFMIAKLILVAILISLVLYAGNILSLAKKGDAEKHMKKLPVIGKATLVITLTIVICAVLNFH